MQNAHLLATPYWDMPEITGVNRGIVSGANLDSELGFIHNTGEDTRVINHNLITTTEDTTWGVSLQGDFDVFSGHTLTMIGAYRDWENVETREGDFLPRAIVGKVNAGINGALRSSALAQRVVAVGLEPAGSTPDEFARLIRSEIVKWRKVVEAAKIRIE